MITTYTFECPVHFLSEKRNKLYEKYCLGVSQLKSVLGAKNGLQGWALLRLEERGA